MEVNPVFWNRQQSCQAVYIAASCLRPNTSTAVASYGIVWGPGDLRNKSGLVADPPDGTTNQLRAELFAMLKALEIAVHERVPKVVFLTNSKAMSDELESWDETRGAGGKSLFRQWSFSNRDLLVQIGELRDLAKEYIYWLALVELEDQKTGFQSALNLAESSLSELESKQTDVVSVPPSITLLPAAIVAIYGQNKKPNKMYIALWGPMDKRNKLGNVHEPAYTFKAEFLAINAVLATAIDTNTTRVRILTRIQNIAEIFQKFRTAPSASIKNHLWSGLVTECVELAGKLEEVHVEHVRSEIACRPLDEAKLRIESKTAGEPETLLGKLRVENADEMVSVQTISSKNTIKTEKIDKKKVVTDAAKIDENDSPVTVYIGGACRERGHINARAMSSVYWGLEDPRNRQCPVDGVVNIIRSKLFAVKMALEIAIEHGIQRLLVRMADQSVLDTLNSQSSPIGNEDLMNDIKQLATNLTDLQFELTPPGELYIRLAEAKAERALNAIVL